MGSGIYVVPSAYTQMKTGLRIQKWSTILLKTYKLNL
jgi:hypothetical protein